MPRYFFHSEDGEEHLDDVGTELQDEAAARVEAVRLVGDILGDRPQEFLETNRWRLLVAGESGAALFSIELASATGAAVVPWG